MARLNPLRLLGLVLVVLAVCSQAASTDRISSRALRRVAVRKEVDIVKKSEEIVADFKAKIKQQLVDPKFPQNYLAERKYYIEWTTVIMFGLLETNLGLPKGSLKDKTTVPPNLDRTEAAVMAKVAYETRHFLRNAIRQREEQRPCMAAVVKLLRFRDLLVYGSGEGPTLPQLIARKYGKMKPPQPPPQDYTQLPKDVALSLVFSAASPNYYVNALTNFIAQKTGNTLSNEQRTHFMQHAGLSQDQINQVLGAVANQAGACSPADKADAMVIDFLLKDGNYNENNDDDDGALFVMPKSKVF